MKDRNLYSSKKKLTTVYYREFDLYLFIGIVFLTFLIIIILMSNTFKVFFFYTSIISIGPFS